MTIEILGFFTRSIFLIPVAALFLIILDRLIFHYVREEYIRKIIAISQSLLFLMVLISGYHLIFNNQLFFDILDFELVRLGNESYNLKLKLDLLSLPFVFTTSVLGGIVGLFASRYMHRDQSFLKFFILYHLFIIGMLFIVLGASLPSIFVGWEIVGLTSALLISFFAYRKQTVTNALKAFWAYRITDSGLFLASLVAIHYHILNFSDFTKVNDPIILFTLASLCLVSAMGKSALFPFGRWLPRAMEGPTPSSAIFYGGLSVHAGLYLMLRISEHYKLPTSLEISLIVIGLITVIYSHQIGKIQSDVKSSLAYAVMMQLGIMFIELGLGFRSLVVFHFIGHAFFRTYQILNAASLLHDRNAFQVVLGHEYEAGKISANNFLYAYAFWETTGGIFSKLSLYDYVEKLAETVRRFDTYLLKKQFDALKYLLQVMIAIRNLTSRANQ